MSHECLPLSRSEVGWTAFFHQYNHCNNASALGLLQNVQCTQDTVYSIYTNSKIVGI